MELYQLRTFIAVAGTGSVTRAAEMLATSQPAVSAQIKALEEEFEVALFLRSAKGMALTTAGQVLLTHAEKVLKESDALLHKVRSLQNEVIGTVRIGLNEDGTFLRIEQLCTLAASKCGRLKLDILNSSSQAILRDLEEKKAGLWFRLRIVFRE